MLGFGLLAVVATTGRFEVLAEPAPYRPRQNARRRAALLGEHRRRRGDPTPGGGSHRQIMTAYRQVALDCALALRGGPLRTRDLARHVPSAPKILLRNVYGWFDRVERRIYRLTALGEREAARAGEGGAVPPFSPLSRQ